MDNENAIDPVKQVTLARNVLGYFGLYGILAAFLTLRNPFILEFVPYIILPIVSGIAMAILAFWVHKHQSKRALQLGFFCFIINSIGSGLTILNFPFEAGPPTWLSLLCTSVVWLALGSTLFAGLIAIEKLNQND